MALAWQQTQALARDAGVITNPSRGVLTMPESPVTRTTTTAIRGNKVPLPRPPGVKLIYGYHRSKTEILDKVPKSALSCAKLAASLLSLDKGRSGGEVGWIALYGDASALGNVVEGGDKWFPIENQEAWNYYISCAGRRSFYADILVRVTTLSVAAHGAGFTRYQSLQAGETAVEKDSGIDASPLRIMLGGHPCDVVGPVLNKVSIEIVKAKDFNAKLDSESSLCVCMGKAIGLKSGEQRTKYVNNGKDPEWNEVLHSQFDHQLAGFDFRIEAGDGTLFGTTKLPIKKLLSELKGKEPAARIGYETDLNLDLPLEERSGRLSVNVKATFNVPYVSPMERIVLPTHLQIGLGWEFDDEDCGIDLDASLVGFDASENIVEQVGYCNMTGFDGAVKHSGDDRSGDGGGDDESLSIDLSRLPSSVVELAICVNSFSGQSISKARTLHLRLIANGKTLAVSSLQAGEIPNCTGLFAAAVCRASKSNLESDWQFIPTWAVANGKTVEDSRMSVVQFGKQKLGW